MARKKKEEAVAAVVQAQFPEWDQVKDNLTMLCLAYRHRHGYAMNPASASRLLGTSTFRSMYADYVKHHGG